jgi:hypothetical protein
LKEDPRNYLIIFVVIGAICFLRYPLNLIIDKLFVERYEIKVEKEVKVGNGRGH